MGYRDDFYIEKNLIGYTGSITRNSALLPHTLSFLIHKTKARDDI